MGQDVSTDTDDFHKKYEGNPAQYIRDMDLSQAESLRQRILSNPKSLSGIPRSMSMNYKAIIVEYDPEIRVEILFMENEADLTVGWLMSETLRKVTEYTKKHGLARDFSNFVALKTKDKKYAIDYWLSNIDRDIFMLKDRITLVPFFSDEKYRLADQKITIDYFEILKMIGVGGYSKVYLARRKDTGQFYAIKVISKYVMIRKGKESAILKERNLMTRMDHPYIVKLHFAFQTEDKLFLVLDFLPGGELFYHIRQRRLFSEEQAKVYAGEILLGLNYLHQNNVIYRDLKPENILVDMDGHLCLADFGLSKEVASNADLNYTFCGSPEYMAPEVVANTGYNFLIDYYALGILVYELVVGAPPFIRTTNGDLFHKILHRDVYLPGHLSSKCKDFLRSLLRKNPKTRLGAREGITEIISHPWLKDLNYGKIILKKVQVPVKPDPYNLNFDKEFIDVRTTGYDLNALTNPREDSLSPKKSFETKRARQRVDDFSFYSNLEDPMDKFTDTLFHDLQSSPFNESKGFQRRSLVGLQSPDSRDRLRKLFESKGLISGSERNSMILFNTQNSSRKSPARNTIQHESRGPKIELVRASLRPEALQSVHEEEKSGLDLTPTQRYDIPNTDRLDPSQMSPKLSVSNIQHREDAEASRNSANLLEPNLDLRNSLTDQNKAKLQSPIGKNANTAQLSHSTSLFASNMSTQYRSANMNDSFKLQLDSMLGSNLTKFSSSPSRRLKLSTAIDSNVVRRGMFHPSELESPHDSPSIFEEKVKRMRPKSTETDRTCDADDVDESDHNEISLFSKAARYTNDPRVNLKHIDCAGKSLFSRKLQAADIRDLENTELHQPLRVSQVQEPGHMLKLDAEYYPRKNNSEGESPSKLNLKLKLEQTLSDKNGPAFSVLRAQNSNYGDASVHKIRLYAEPSEIEVSSYQLRSTTSRQQAEEYFNTIPDMWVLDKKISQKP